MKSSKKVLALALAAAMVVTAVPTTNASAATTGVAKSKTYYAGKSYTLTLTTPKSWKSVKTTWTSSKKSVAKVAKKSTKKAKVTAVKAGTANVKVKVTYAKSTKKNAKKYTKTYTCKVTVKNPSIVAPKTAEVAIGATASIAATAKPASAVVSYATDNASVATVDANGVVTGVAAGTAKITATVQCGTVKKTAETTVTVVDLTAKKIESVTATSVKTFEVKFDGTVKDTAANTFKVSRAGTDVAMTAKWSEDNTSAILTSESALQAGTYTVAYGDMTGTVTVQAQKATKIEVLTTKVGLGNNLGSQQKVYYKVLDQYGNDMGIASNRLTINATNMSKNHTINPISNANKTNTYFEISTSTLTDAIGDKIAVVAYLTSDVTVSVSANIEIANVYTKEFTFGEPDKGKDAHIFADKTDYRYSLPYTATDSEDNKVLLNKTATTLGATATTNNITFVSSNPATIDPSKIKIDSNGKLTFVTGSYASTVTITALNTVTGATSKVDIVVGKKSTLTSLEVTDVTISKGSDTAKAEIIGRDQYGDVVSPLDMANVDLKASLFTLNGSAYQSTTTAVVTKDGKYVEFKNLANTASGTVGSKFNIIFISTVDPSKSSTANIIIGDAKIASYFKVDSSAVDTLFAGSKGDLKLTAYDNYDNEMDGIGTDFDYDVEVGGQVTADFKTFVSSKKYQPIEVTAKSGSAITGASDNGSVTVTLYAKDTNSSTGWTEVESKVIPVVISNVARNLNVSTDKSSYASGDKINVEVRAYNGSDFLSNFNATVAATVSTHTDDEATSAAKDSKTENLTFKNGVATTTVDAKAGVKSVKVVLSTTNATVGTPTGIADKLTVDSASTATKYGVVVSGSAITITAQNGVGETVTGYAGSKAITIKVEKKNGSFTDDVTDDFITNKAPIVTFVNGVATIDAKTNITADSTTRYTVTITEQNGTIVGTYDIK